MKSICVIGSLNIDLVYQVEALPRPGETVLGDAFHQFYGGKGGNQAMALGRLGAHVAMMGSLGDGLGAASYLALFQQTGVDTSLVALHQGQMPGVATIGVDAAGENSIVVIPGANLLMYEDLTQTLSQHEQALQAYDLFLLQQEIPKEANVSAMMACRRQGKTVIYDPAPASAYAPDPGSLPALDYLSLATYVTPNETELALLAQHPTDTEDNMANACARLHQKGAQTIIAKAGGQGSYLYREGAFTHIPPFSVQPVDTTAAGDAFNAGFAFALSKDYSLEKALLFANATGALATTGLGAHSALPTEQQVLALMAAQPSIR